MNSRFVVALALAMAASAAGAHAHHSFAATYDESKMVTVEGKLIQFQFRNPHSFVHLMVADANGQEQRWSIEWGAAGQLGGQGVSRDTLKAGDVVWILGNPGRNPADRRIRMLTLKRASDGFSWGDKAGETVD
jgi:hypothetical protein